MNFAQLGRSTVGSRTSYNGAISDELLNRSTTDLITPVAIQEGTGMKRIKPHGRRCSRDYLMPLCDIAVLRNSGCFFSNPSSIDWSPFRCGKATTLQKNSSPNV